MKSILGYIAWLVGVLILIIILTRATKGYFYRITHEDLVKETIREMVKEGALK